MTNTSMKDQLIDKLNITEPTGSISIEPADGAVPVETIAVALAEPPQPATEVPPQVAQATGSPVGFIGYLMNHYFGDNPLYGIICKN